MVGKHHFRIERKLSSYRFKDDMNSPDSWDGDHNAKHNCEDVAILYDGDHEVMRIPVQTVANIPGGRHTDTIAPGRFAIKWDVPRRSFKGRVHGIVGAVDQDGQTVDEDSVQRVPGKNGAPVDFARWIAFHTDEKADPAPENTFTRYLWSAGCFITKKQFQQALWFYGVGAGFKTGDKIPCLLVEIP